MYRSWLATACILCSLTVLPAQAQIVPDQTLGNEGSILEAGSVDRITGGAARGNNLFHSFQTFNISPGQQVYFANPAGIGTILSRVTGPGTSEILGTLGVSGDASLFLINPQGIVFGPEATLDVPGSFYATTAEAVGLGDAVFSATAPAQSQLLAVSPSTAFWRYLTPASADITNRAQLAAGGDLTLAAGRLDLAAQIASGGGLSLLAADTVQIRDTSAAPFIGFGTEELLIQGNQQVNIVALSHPDSGLYTYGDLTLRSASQVGGDAHYYSGGGFRVEGLDGELGDLYSPIDPIIRALGNVEFDNYFGSSLHIIAGGSVRFNSATITTPDPGTLGVDFLRENVQLSDGTVVAIDGGARPTLDVRAGADPDSIGISENAVLSGINPFLDTFSDGGFQLVPPNLGNNPSSADIEVGSVSFFGSGGVVLLTNQYRPNLNLTGGNITVVGNDPFNLGIRVGINTASPLLGNSGDVVLDSRQNISVIGTSISTRGENQTGDILLLAEDRVSLSGSGLGISSGAFTDISGGIGEAGSIRIAADNLDILNGARLSSSVFSGGRAGDIDLNIEDDIRVDGLGSAIFSNVESFASTDSANQAGRIRIKANSLTVSNGAFISNSIFGLGSGQAIVIDIADSILLDRGNIFSSVGDAGNGQAGDIRINTADLVVAKGSQIATTLNGTGVAGDIRIDAKESVTVQDFLSLIASGINLRGTGQGGDILITTEALDVNGGGLISSSTLSTGSAGNIVIDADGAVRLAGLGLPGVGGIFSSSLTDRGGPGGDISMAGEKLTLEAGATVSAQSQSQSDAGNIFIRLQSDLEAQDGNISTSAERSAGGQIQISGGIIFLFGDSDIVTFVESGADDGGSITINADAVIAFDDSDILSFAADGRGGDVDLGQTAFFGEDFELAASNTDPRILDGNGRVDINASGAAASGEILLPDVTFIENSLTELPDSLVNPEALVASSCIARQGDTTGSFAITGGQGLPQQPSGSQAVYQLGTVQALDESLAEPQQLYRLGDGRLVLSRHCDPTTL